MCSLCGKKIEKTNFKIRNEIYSGYDYYEVGPWIILDMMKELYSITGLVDIEEIENKISNEEKISEDIKIQIIRDVFHLDIEMFISKLDNYIKL